MKSILYTLDVKMNIIVSIDNYEFKQLYLIERSLWWRTNSILCTVLYMHVYCIENLS